MNYYRQFLKGALGEGGCSQKCQALRGNRSRRSSCLTPDWSSMLPSCFLLSGTLLSSSVQILASQCRATMARRRVRVSLCERLTYILLLPIIASGDFLTQCSEWPFDILPSLLIRPYHDRYCRRRGTDVWPCSRPRLRRALTNPPESTPRNTTFTRSTVSRRPQITNTQEQCLFLRRLPLEIRLDCYLSTKVDWSLMARSFQYRTTSPH